MKQCSDLQYIQEKERLAYTTGVCSDSAGALSCQETSLRRMSEGLQLHQALLKQSVEPRLDNKACVEELDGDITDLLTQIHKVAEDSGWRCPLWDAWLHSLD